jgi:hypothetical protein
VSESKRDKTTQLSFRLDEYLHRRFTSKVKLHGREAKDILTAAVKLYLIDELHEELVAGDVPLHKSEGWKSLKDLVTPPEAPIIAANIKDVLQPEAQSYPNLLITHGDLAYTIAKVLRDTLLTVQGPSLIFGKSDTVSVSGGGPPELQGPASGEVDPAPMHDLLDRIFTSGHPLVISAISHNLLAFGMLVDLITQGRPDDILPAPTETHPREKTAESRPAGKKTRKIA